VNPKDWGSSSPVQLVCSGVTACVSTSHPCVAGLLHRSWTKPR